MMSAVRLPCHKLCLSNTTALRRIRVVPTCTNIARLYSTPSAPRDAHQNFLKKRIQDINADPNITDLQKYTNSIRLHYDIEFLQSLHKAEIQVQHFRELFRQSPPASDTLPKWDDALRKLDVVLEEVVNARWRAFIPSVFAPWADVSLETRIRRVLRLIWANGIGFPIARMFIRLALRIRP